MSFLKSIVKRVAHSHQSLFLALQSVKDCNLCHFISMFVCLYQGRSTKIKTGQAIDDMTQTRGAGGMPPGHFLKFKCSVSTFGAILGPSTLQ